MAVDDGLRGSSAPEVAGVVTIYDYEYRLLEEVSRYEQNNACSTPYVSQYPSDCHDPLITMTLAEVREHQARRMQRNRTYQAVGRYQFIYDTLAEVVNGSGTSWDAIFDVETQDWLAVYYMRSVGLERWLEGSYTNAASNDNDVAWMVRLGMIWAAIPMPITIPANRMGRNAPRATRQPGNSFYEGSINSAGDKNPANFLRDLRAIRRSGRGNAHAVNIQLVADPDRPRIRGATNIPGSTPGQGNYYSSARLPGGDSQTVINTYSACLGPQNSEPYSYKPLDPLDNRYDFRLGDKVRDLLENGQTAIQDLQPSTSGISRGGSDGALSIEDQAAREAEVGLDAFGGTGEPAGTARDADGNLIPLPGESITDFQARLREDSPGTNYSDYADQDVDDVLAGRTPRQYNPDTGNFEYPLVSQQSSN